LDIKTKEKVVRQIKEGIEVFVMGLFLFVGSYLGLQDFLPIDKRMASLTFMLGSVVASCGCAWILIGFRETSRKGNRNTKVIFWLLFTMIALSGSGVLMFLHLFSKA
jgi:hypothetical protein